jgi:hypothetical protein
MISKTKYLKNKKFYNKLLLQHIILIGGKRWKKSKNYIFYSLPLAHYAFIIREDEKIISESRIFTPSYYFKKEEESYYYRRFVKFCKVINYNLYFMISEKEYLNNSAFYNLLLLEEARKAGAKYWKSSELFKYYLFPYKSYALMITKDNKWLEEARMISYADNSNLNYNDSYKIFLKFCKRLKFEI